MPRWVVHGIRHIEVEAETSNEALLCAIDEFNAMHGYDSVEVERVREPLLPPDLPIAQRRR